MIFIPFMLLVLSGGVYLLMEAQSKGLGRLYKLLSGLVIILSLLFLTAGVIHHRHMARMHHEHERFFRGEGCRFGPHHFGGQHMFDWKNRQAAVADSTGK